MIFGRILNAVVNRVPLGVSGQRLLIESALRHLPESVYWRLREMGFRPGGIIDIGAHEGSWTELVRGIFPEPPVLMIEARVDQEPVLGQVCARLPNVNYVIALLGRNAQSAVPFHVSGTGSSIFAERSDADRVLRRMPMRTLDEVANDTFQLKGPLFIKLDIQGAELECIQGGDAVLDKAEVVQLEVALLNYNEFGATGSRGYYVYGP